MDRMGCKPIYENNVKQKTGRVNIDITGLKTLCVNKAVISVVNKRVCLKNNPQDSSFI